MSSSSNSNAVVGEVDVVKSSYKWTLNFCVGCKKVSEKLTSPAFSTSVGAIKHQWELSLYPKGLRQSCKDWLSLFLKHLDETDITASVTFKILNNKNKVAKTLSAGKHTFTKDMSDWGYASFVERDFIMDKDNAVLNDDKLTILCEIKEDTSVNCTQDAEEKEKEKENIIKDSERLQELDKLEALIDDKDFSDVSFTVEGKLIRAHKCILASKSPVFAAMFRHEMKEKQESTVEIEEIKHEVFVEMLRFIYAGKINGIEKMAGDLMAGADRYSLDGLKATCEKTLDENLSIGNAVETLRLADLHRADTLKAKTIEFIVSHVNEIVDKPEFEMLADLDLDVRCEVFRAIALNKRK